MKFKEEKVKDAWERQRDLDEEYIVNFELRSDLRISAQAHHRTVKINGVQHNVATIREYIELLEEACDWVEGYNPEWTKRAGA